MKKYLKKIKLFLVVIMSAFFITQFERVAKYTFGQGDIFISKVFADYPHTDSGGEGSAAGDSGSAGDVGAGTPGDVGGAMGNASGPTGGNDSDGCNGGGGDAPC